MGNNGNTANSGTTKGPAAGTRSKINYNHLTANNRNLIRKKIQALNINTVKRYGIKSVEGRNIKLQVTPNVVVALSNSELSRINKLIQKNINKQKNPFRIAGGVLIGGAGKVIKFPGWWIQQVAQELPGAKTLGGAIGSGVVGKVTNSISNGIGYTNENSPKQLRNIINSVVKVATNKTLKNNNKLKIGRNIGKNVSSLITKAMYTAPTYNKNGKIVPSRFAPLKKGVMEELKKNWEEKYVNSEFLNVVLGTNAAATTRVLVKKRKAIMEGANAGMAAYGVYAAGGNKTKTGIVAGQYLVNKAGKVIPLEYFPKTKAGLGYVGKGLNVAGAGLRAVNAAGRITTLGGVKNIVVGVLPTTYKYLPQAVKNRLSKFSKNKSNAILHKLGEKSRRSALNGMTSVANMGIKERANFFKKYPEFSVIKKWFNAANGLLGPTLHINTRTAANGIVNTTYKNGNKNINFELYNWNKFGNKNHSTRNLTPKDIQIIENIKTLIKKREKNMNNFLF